MALDSRAKRASVVGVGRPWMGSRVTPDATKPQAWRQAVGHGYYGILVSAAVAIADIIGPTVLSIVDPARLLAVIDPARVLAVTDPGRAIRFDDSS